VRPAELERLGFSTVATAHPPGPVMPGMVDPTTRSPGGACCNTAERAASGLDEVDRDLLCLA